VYPGTDPYTLWRTRAWRKLLNLIDHLPQNTWYHAAVSMDVEHAMMVLEAQERAERLGQPGPPKGPGLQTWSPEVAELVGLRDDVRNQTAVIVKSNGGNAREPKPLPRPATANETARLRKRMRDHDILRRRMLPHLYADDE